MPSVGIISKDVVTKNRISEVLRAKDIDCNYIHSAANFDPEAFDVLMVDLGAPQAELILRMHPRMCIAFGAESESDKEKRKAILGCDRIYKSGEFFKKVLPKFEL